MRDRLIELINQAEKKFYDTDNSLSNVEKYVADYLLENGVIVPPCKVGDTVYVICYGKVTVACVTEFEINPKGIIVKVYIDPDTYNEYDIEDIYASEEEAEAALKARDLWKKN